VLTQRSTAIVPQMPIGVSNETVVDRTFLFLTPLLKSAASHSPAFSPFENNPERGRAQRLKKFGSTAGRALSPRSSHPAHPLSVGLGARQSARFAGQGCAASKVLSRLWVSFSTACLSISRTGSNCYEITGRVVSRSRRRPVYARGPAVQPFGRARCTRSLFRTVLINTMLACYRLKARRHAPGLTPTVCLKTRVR
jgi:hypothetical protein